MLNYKKLSAPNQELEGVDKFPFSIYADHYKLS